MMKQLLLLLSALASTPVFSHTGHLANESTHGFLHVEHIVMIAAVGIVIHLVNKWLNQ